MARIRVSRRILTRWQKLAAAESDPTIDLVLGTAGPARDVLPAVRQAVAAALGVVGAAAGSVDVLEVRGGVVLQVGGGCTAFESLLGAVVDALQADGVAGPLDLFRVTWDTLPERAPLIELRMRVDGVGVRDRFGIVWTIRGEVLSAVLGAAVEWLLADRDVALVAHRGSIDPGRVVRPVDALDYVTEASSGRASIVLDRVADSEFRRLVVQPWAGTVSLSVGRGDLSDAWRSELERFRAVLATLGSVVAYGHVKRGGLPVLVGSGSLGDWPRIGRGRPSFDPGHSEMFDSWRAPDAFGVQLFGRRFGIVLPSGMDWRVTRLGGGASLVEHVRPEAWFTDAFPLRSTHVEVHGWPVVDDGPPPVLVEARRDLAPWLVTQEVFASAFMDVPERTSLLELRMRVVGAAVRDRSRVTWRARQASLLEVVGEAVRWLCAASLAVHGARGYAVRRALATSAEIIAYVLDAVDADDAVVVYGTSADGFRQLNVEPLSGRVSLVVGGEAVASGWAEELEQLRVVLCGVAASIVYGLVKRGSVPALASHAAFEDWPHRDPELSVGRDAMEGFEWSRAPDAFGIQLFGPGYPVVVPLADEWRVARLSGGAWLVEHADAGAWFSEAFDVARAEPAPAVLERARVDLAPWLIAQADIDVAPVDPVGSAL